MKTTPMMVCAALVLSGCTVGGDDAQSPSPETQADASAGADAGGEEATADADDTSAPPIEGTWAQMLVYGAINDIPAVGQMSGATTTIQRVTVTREDTTLTMSVEPCAIEIDNGTDVIQTIIPDAFLKSLGVTGRTGHLAYEGGQWRYVQDSKLQLRGVHLDAPETDSLPTDASDPRVWDQDEDGNPGVTVRITGLTDGEVYVVQRDIHSIDAVVGGDHIDGLVSWSTEQVVLGSDNPVLNMQTQSAKDPDPSASYVRSTRVQEAVDCAGILASRDSLFAR